MVCAQNNYIVWRYIQQDGFGSLYMIVGDLFKIILGQGYLDGKDRFEQVVYVLACT